jgi:phosphoribosylpyrophosphate synthetase
VLSIAPLFAETIKRIHEERPLGELFDIWKR